MKRFIQALMLTLFLAGCSSASSAPTPDLPTLIAPSPAPATATEEGVTLIAPDTPASQQAATPVCISTDPTQDDIDRALGFPGKVFDRGDWQRSYTVADTRVSVTWYSDAIAAVAYLEALIFPCGYEEPDLDAFFTDQNWSVVFGNYQEYSLAKQCATDNGLRLYTFRAVDQGFEYEARYWVRNDTDTRVIAMMLVFPMESPAVQDEYAYSIFPQLINCP